VGYDKTRATRLRAKAKRLGLRLSRSRAIHGDDRRGWQVVESRHNLVIHGGRWELSLDDVEDLLVEEEAAVLAASRRVTQAEPGG
jgi:hypothetical protein